MHAPLANGPSPPAQLSAAPARAPDRPAVAAEAVDALVLGGEAQAPPRAALTRHAERRWHQAFLAAALLVLALASCLQVREGRDVVAPGIQAALPQLCTVRRLTGLDCPGCGLTRSVICLAHGDPVDSWRMNPAGLLVFLVVVGQLPYRAAQLWRLRQGKPPLPGPHAAWVLGVLAAALLAQWSVRTWEQ